jgi:hypothetical protein
VNTSKPTVFVCYRRHDTSGYVRALREGLEASLGKSRVFVDIDSIPPGVDFRETASEAIAKSDVVLVLIGPNWMQPRPGSQRSPMHENTDPVRNELLAALELGRPIVPVLLGGAAMPKADQLPTDIAKFADINAFEITDRHYATDFDRLILRVNTFVQIRPKIDRRALMKASFLGAGVAGVGAVVFIASAPKHTEAPRTGGPPASSPGSADRPSASSIDPGSLTTPRPTQGGRTAPSSQTLFEFYSRATQTLAKLQTKLEITSKVGQWMGFTDEYLSSAKQFDEFCHEFVALTSQYSPETSTAVYGEVMTRISLYLLHFLYSATFFSWSWPGFDMSSAITLSRRLLSRLDATTFESDGQRLSTAQLPVPAWTGPLEFDKLSDQFDGLNKTARDLVAPASGFAQRQEIEAQLRRIVLQFDVKYISLATKLNSMGTPQLKLHLSRNSILLYAAQINCAYATSRLDMRTWIENALLVANAHKDYTSALAKAIAAALNEKGKPTPVRR